MSAYQRFIESSESVAAAVAVASSNRIKEENRTIISSTSTSSLSTTTSNISNININYNHDINRTNHNIHNNHPSQQLIGEKGTSNTTTSTSCSNIRRRRRSFSSPSQIMTTIIKTPQIFTSKVQLNATSTPITKQQYKRLVEAEHLAIKQQQEFEESVSSHYTMSNNNNNNYNTVYNRSSCRQQLASIQHAHDHHNQHHHHHHHHHSQHQQQSSRHSNSSFNIAPPPQFCHSSPSSLNTQHKLHYGQLASYHHTSNEHFHSPLCSSPQNVSQAHQCQFHQHHQQHQHDIRHQSHKAPQRFSPKVEAYFKTDDPVLLQWLKDMRFETELECLTKLRPHSLANDKYSATALSIRNSQVAIQEMRLQSDAIMEELNCLIASLPLQINTIEKFIHDFSNLWRDLVAQTAPQPVSNQQENEGDQTITTLAPNRYANNNQQLTIINCTPKKAHSMAQHQKPRDVLANQIRKLCTQLLEQLYSYLETTYVPKSISNEDIEASLRKIMELYGKFMEISIRFECVNIVRGLDYDFSQSSLNRLSSSSSLQPARPFESSSSQLPLKWALIALWQLTQDDSFLCRLLTERWQTVDQMSPVSSKSTTNVGQMFSPKNRSTSRVAKRLDYSTNCEMSTANENLRPQQITNNNLPSQQVSSLITMQEYEQLYNLTMKHDRAGQVEKSYHAKSQAAGPHGALMSELKMKRQQPTGQVSTIEFLIDIIISQPNKHERLDMLNFIHSKTEQETLIDIDERQRDISAAVYTSNQYKVAALRILNHLCVNQQAIKTILKCLNTPPPNKGLPPPENKIIRSIFECYQSSQEHIYQNETMLHKTNYFQENNSNSVSSQARGRKRTRQVEDDEYSDYGSIRQTTSQQTSSIEEHCAQTTTNQADDRDDVVVKEAIRLLVQITTPFLTYHGSNEVLDYYNLIGSSSVNSLVKYLTNIIKSSTNREMIFLSLTALANISFITTEPIRTNGTNSVMLEMFRSSKNRSKDLELRDQAVTILANTADKYVLDIVNSGGLNFLLSCLESCPTKMYNYRQKRDPLPDDESISKLNIENKPRERKPIDFKDDLPDILVCVCDDEQQKSNLHSSHLRLDTSPKSLRQSTFDYNYQSTSSCLSKLTVVELASLERIHQKTAVAFARMSVDSSTTGLVLKHGGIKQMIDLCKFSHKRNHSDNVLKACLVALRRMATVINRETFKYYNALDLIELEPKQALEIYGNTNKSPSSILNTRQTQSQYHSRIYLSDV